MFIDEVHHLKNWQLIIKNIYDDFPNMNIVYTGSSLLK
ncbi:MAG: AAA family ATPase, partial [Lachnospiraceae bacterium]|nr:AAA family ATPase [Lachnospiraceae bacterium]